MEVLVDDKQVDDAFIAGGITVEDALKHLQSEVCGPERMVVTLRCDGRDVPPHTMAEILQKPADSFGRLEILTGTKEALVSDALEQASACLSETQAACRRVAELLTTGSTDDAVRSLGECMAVWQQVHEAIGKSMEVLQLDSEAIMVNETPLVELIGKPKGTLLQVKEALVAHDYVMLADILQYEFDEVTEVWHQIIDRIRQEVEAV